MSKYFNVITPTNYGPMIINRFDTVIGASLSLNGVWEPNDIDCMYRITKAFTGGGKPVLLDIGANVGSHVVALSSLFQKEVEIHAFEAQRQVFMIMAGNMALNSLENVFIYHNAVSDVSGQTVTFPAVNYLAPSNFGAFELIPAHHSDFDGHRVAGKFETVKTVRIDDFDFADVSLMKIDVEGMEEQVLLGARETIARNRPALFLEFHKSNFERIKDLLREMNYKSYFFNQWNILCVPIERAIFPEGLPAVE